MNVYICILIYIYNYIYRGCGYSMVAYGNAFHDVPWFRFTWWSIKTSPPSCTTRNGCTRYPSNRLPLLHPNWDHSTIHSIGDLNTSESFTFTLRIYWLAHTAASHEKTTW